MTRRSPCDAVDPRGPYDPDALLDLLDTFPDTVIVGFESTQHHVDLHVRPLPEDPRAGAAGLFGMRALPGWGAAGVAFGGRARSTDTGDVVDEEATGAVVVTGDGRVASRLRIDGEPQHGCGAAVGTLVDALHRFLGLPSPGSPPHPVHLVTALWAHQLLEVVLVEGELDWDTAIGLHPGDPGPGSSCASDEMLLEATIRATDGFDWSDVHSRSARGLRPAYGLTRREAAWMDTTMFARWVAGSLPDPRLVVQVVRAQGCESVAARLSSLLDAADRVG